MAHLSRVRLIALRVVYALITFAMGAMTWSAILTHSGDWSTWPAVVKCMLGALTLLTAVGVVRPLAMLPVLLWELLWKTIWLLAVWVPAFLSGSVSPETQELAWQIVWVVLVYAAVPWRYVWTLLRRGEPARRPAPEAARA